MPPLTLGADQLNNVPAGTIPLIISGGVVLLIGLCIIIYILFIKRKRKSI